ncbi:hypothetical protein [Streptomyces griseosporeus]|uniref:hypothetical protein n=1 Tax=Streptomyces griseosporeus TaxID=1910 RepID=UPI003703031A
MRMTPGPVAASVEESILHAGAGAEPIFEDLARSWEAFGRTVPGREDPQWDRLLRSSPWSRPAAETGRPD